MESMAAACKKHDIGVGLHVFEHVPGAEELDTLDGLQRVCIFASQKLTQLLGAPDQETAVSWVQRSVEASVALKNYVYAVLKSYLMGDFFPFMVRTLLYHTEKPADISLMWFLPCIVKRGEHVSKYAFISYSSGEETQLHMYESVMHDHLGLKFTPVIVNMVELEGHIVHQNAASMAAFGMQGYVHRAEGSTSKFNLLEELFVDQPAVRAEMEAVTAASNMFSQVMAVRSQLLRKWLGLGTRDVWHQVQISRARDAVTMRYVYVVAQVDVTAAVLAETQVVRLMAENDNLAGTSAWLEQERAKADEVNQRLKESLAQALATRDNMLQAGRVTIDTDSAADKAVKLLNKFLEGQEVSSREVLAVRDVLLKAGTDMLQPVNFVAQMDAQMGATLDAEVGQSLIDLLVTKHTINITDGAGSSSNGAPGGGDGASGPGSGNGSNRRLPTIGGPVGADVKPAAGGSGLATLHNTRGLAPEHEDEGRQEQGGADSSSEEQGAPAQGEAQATMPGGPHLGALGNVALPNSWMLMDSASNGSDGGRAAAAAAGGGSTALLAAAASQLTGGAGEHHTSAPVLQHPPPAGSLAESQICLSSSSMGLVPGPSSSCSSSISQRALNPCSGHGPPGSQACPGAGAQQAASAAHPAWLKQAGHSAPLSPQRRSLNLRPAQAPCGPACTSSSSSPRTSTHHATIMAHPPPPSDASAAHHHAHHHQHHHMDLSELRAASGASAATVTTSGHSMASSTASGAPVPLYNDGAPAPVQALWNTSSFLAGPRRVSLPATVLGGGGTTVDQENHTTPAGPVHGGVLSFHRSSVVGAPLTSGPPTLRPVAAPLPAGPQAMAMLQHQLQQAAAEAFSASALSMSQPGNPTFGSSSSGPPHCCGGAQGGSNTHAPHWWPVELAVSHGPICSVAHNAALGPGATMGGAGAASWVGARVGGASLQDVGGPGVVPPQTFSASAASSPCAQPRLAPSAVQPASHRHLWPPVGPPPPGAPWVPPKHAAQSQQHSEEEGPKPTASPTAPTTPPQPPTTTSTVGPNNNAGAEPTTLPSHASSSWNQDPLADQQHEQQQQEQQRQQHQEQQEQQEPVPPEQEVHQLVPSAAAVAAAARGARSRNYVSSLAPDATRAARERQHAMGLVQVCRSPSDPLARVLATADDWGFNPWQLHEVAQGQPLSCLGFYLLHRHLSEPLKSCGVDVVKLCRFLIRVEEDYNANPYHNRIHAADVLQWTHVLMQRGGVLRALNIGDAGMLGVYLSAIVHDLNHTGLNNDYLVRSNDPLALLYNDVSPMENHHLAHTFSLLKLDDYNFLTNCSNDRVKETLRKQIIKMVLATDMKQHFTQVALFKSKLGVTDEAETALPVVPPAPALNATGSSGHGSAASASMGTANTSQAGGAGAGAGAGGQEAEATPASVLAVAQDDDEIKGLILAVALKCADLGNLAAPKVVNGLWVQQLEEEYFRQGDLEQANGLPVSALMDRSKAGVSKCQTGFMNIVGLPLFRMFAKAFPSARPMLEGALLNFEHWRGVEEEQRRQVAMQAAGAAQEPAQ